MQHIRLSNRYSKEELMHLEILSRLRPLSTLKSLIDSVEVNNYSATFAIAIMDSKGEFTEDDVHFISINPEIAYYIPLSTRSLDTNLKGMHIFKITETEVKELKAAELISGCLKAALIHLVNGLEDTE
ncbi:MAG: hypothetical protein KIG60_01130 [Caryophanon sp.]|nr:hypothetical protein [Caryophanon sp.]